MLFNKIPGAKRFPGSCVFWAVALGFLLCFEQAALAYRGGPPPTVDGSAAAGGLSCRACHGNALGSGSVQILGFPAQYEADLVYNISIRISDPLKVGAGFQASVQTSTGQPAGTIVATDPTNTQLNQDSSPLWRGINHTFDGVDGTVLNWVAMGNSATYSFQWRAPASDVGPLTAWAAGNAINNNGSNSGDNIYLTNSTATFAAEPTGACCDGDTGSCTDHLTAAECVGDQSSWSADIECADLDPPCTEHTGACCDQLTGSCSDGVPGSACIGVHQSWTKGAFCANTACDAVTGACCDVDAFGVCADDQTQGQCSCVTCVWTQDTPCSEVECTHTVIPTVGEWGLVLLTLLLAISAKIVFRMAPGGDRVPA